MDLYSKRTDANIASLPSLKLPLLSFPFYQKHRAGIFNRWYFRCFEIFTENEINTLNWAGGEVVQGNKEGRQEEEIFIST